MTKPACLFGLIPRRHWILCWSAGLLAAGCSPRINDAPVEAETYPGIIRLACVGDSLTGCPDSWPVHIEPMLGQRWEVRNFGLGGATVLSFGDHPYVRLKLPEVLAYAPDVVLVCWARMIPNPAIGTTGRIREGLRSIDPYPEGVGAAAPDLGLPAASGLSRAVGNG
jgi:hypothetical protein